jgi:hypothetical protein
MASYVDGPPWQALFSASNDLVGCGHMSGLLARSMCPLALMRSDDQDPINGASFALVTPSGLFLAFGGDRVVHHVSLRLPNSNL